MNTCPDLFLETAETARGTTHQKQDSAPRNAAEEPAAKPAEYDHASAPDPSWEPATTQAYEEYTKFLNTTADAAPKPRRIEPLPTGDYIDLAWDSARDAPPPTLNEAVVRIETSTAIGSGFFVAEDVVATNAHVVGRDGTVTIALSGRTQRTAKVLYRDDDLDFALIRSPFRGVPLTPRLKPLYDQENVLAAGFPQGRNVVAGSTGTIRSIVECCVQHDALIAAGSSGGPLVDVNNEVIGINTILVKGDRDTKNESDRAWAVKMSFVLEVLNSKVRER